jgi:serine/threonine-protein kinase
MAWTLAAVLGVALAGSLFWPTRDTGSGLDDVVRMVLDPAPAGGISIGAADTESAAEVATLAISEDGLRIAFIGRVDGDSVTHLYLRDLGDFEARQLPGTEHATSPFFSPDGEWLGFYSWREGRLKRISVLGGEPQVVCTCEPILSATWGPDGIIVMDHHGLGGLRLVDASGGTPQPLAPGRDILEDDEHSLIHPQFLPDGRHVLVTAWGGAGAIRRIAAVSIDAGERTTLLEDGWAPQFVPSGHLVYLRTNQLWAAPLDAESLEVTGTAEPVVDSVFSAPFLSLAAISRSGTLVYAPGPLPDVGTSLYRVGRSGEEERLPGGAMTWSAWGPALAPDGRRIAFWGSDADGFSSGQGASRIWVYDPSQGRARAITDAGAGDFWPTWSADGREIAFTSLRSAPMGLYRVASDGSTSPESLLGYEGGIVQPGSWLSDGQGLIYQRAEDLESDFDIWLLPFEEDSDPVPLVQGPANEVHPALSPDSRWLAYASDQSGQYEVYLTPYPQLDRTLQVSRSGGMGPRWRSDSRELFFYAEGGQVSGWAASFMRSLVDREPSPPEALWSRAGVFSTGLTYGHGYDVTPGGETFIVALNESPPSLFLSDLHLVFNWLVELEARFED